MATTAAPIGWLVGEEHRGMQCMFTMMNRARLDVGLQGVAIAERAYQQARDFARTRVQGRPAGASETGAAEPILHHADVRRMLLVAARRDRGDARARPITSRARPTARGTGPTTPRAQRRSAASIFSSRW